MNSKQNPGPIFSGEFCHSLDSKNRVTVPARWRSSEADEFYLMLDRSNSFLRVMPPDQYRAIGEKLDANPAISAQEKTKFKRIFYSGCQQVVVDKQGRMLVPEEFGKALGLQGESVLVGAYETFELWNPTAWAKTKQLESATFDKVADLLGL